jgi:hypothetical protein
MKRCLSKHPDNKAVKCSRPDNHIGDHKCNGLVWERLKKHLMPRYHCVCGMSFPSPVPDEHIATHPDPVNHPKHYTNHPSGIECIDVVRHMNFNRGNAIKYVWRAGEKGPVIEDLRKAIWYLQDEIKRLENGGT